MENKTTNSEELFTCAKCGKKKKKSEGVFVLEGSTFCCKDCCGDASKGEHKEKAAAVCEFC
ncbi:hypothetical protein A3H65_00985 [Candidatus Giovannonibacteria bacterium RIFCSPLOWO2_02_FULL_45_14]|uniref:Metallothionein n=1 Tax=Candidatus Giovannonibacteria bacterium RIFCSPLOWO2_12_FULL_44_15 TaxID=1798364 RepID=A0A1F5XZY0_9BACT|nr:MAG: hypothetical protein A3C75_01410 [Candidatus Giovannonibacteria bacterium RIFCSPHIGHO2_02_FULL_44_31]OGF76020.1 MAG: hypothetical protein A3E62_01820 [Candidatus Giovannonibacteria bacterium RIFCSPHIGHO2_12_FULL_44_29]OGF90916.1 MAG: hypothetical protein A3H65_00985 [Candidatus Giovannonibacteria bacterium RIFCSPLOWO2_02_FULL_45_14]OGF93436.1 MAG: hypothetical protein A3G54_04055 [Candidatus Giovannonibacteria bacterium RIFCSPLOWO2_12_FULL_44_15]